jgi:uncharacterized protein YnzC (UPF0291/DUF896 family)
MDPREELAALRRLAELEAKASGATAPAAPVGQIPGAGPYQAPPAEAQIPMGRRAIQLVRPTVEALGTAGGAVVGTPAGPLGIVGGAGLGYGLSKGALDTLETALGYRQGPTSAPQAILGAASDVGVGGLTEGVGRGLIAPAVQKGAQLVARAQAGVKVDTYRKALEGKGEDILALLRGAETRTPGSAAGAGEVAAPAGSAKFSNLQRQAEKILPSEFGFMEAQAGAAQAAQQTRAQAKFAAAAGRVEAKMNSALAQVRPEDAGAALKSAADAQRESMKKGVIEPAYKAAFDAAGTAKVGMDDVIAKAEEILGRKLSSFDPSSAPETVRKLLALQAKAPPPAPLGAGKISGRIKVAPPAPPPAEVTLQQLDDIRKAINVDIAAGRVSTEPGAAMRLRNLGQIHSTIDDAVAKSSLSDEAKSLYSEALAKYREQYVPRFKTGVNEQLFRATGLNEPKIKPEDVITKYFQPRGVSEARNFLDLFGKDPKAMQVARAGIEDLYAREVGKFTPEAHAAFLKKYADPIRVLDDGGMNVLQRINVVGQNAARLEKINELAKRTFNTTLAPPLPPGATADAVERRIGALTKGMTPQQLSHVNAVQQDLLRRGEYERLASMGENAAPDILKAGKEAIGEIGLPTASYLNRALTLFNDVARRLALRIDKKTALEIAREMTNPALAAKSVKQAAALEARLAAGAPARTATGRVVRGLAERTPGAAILGGTNALAPESENVNALAP